MNILKIATLIVSCFGLYGCATSEYFIKPGINLNGFEYVGIYGDNAHNIQTVLGDLFERKGVKVISKTQFNRMTESDYNRLMLCEVIYRYTRGLRYYATIYLNIYNSNKDKIFSSNGEKWSGGISGENSDARNALELAFDEFAKKYERFNPIYTVDLLKQMKDEFNDWEKIGLTESELKIKLSSYSSDLNPIEGIWSSIEDNQYRLGIIRETNNSKRDFVAFILETDNPLWEVKQVKIEFKSTAYKSVFSTTYFMSDHSKQGTTSFINDKGILEIKLKNPEDNSELNTAFIKNYPSTNEKSFVDINKGNSQTSGTGFIISESGLIVTNWHVVENSNSIEVFFPQINKTFDATTVIKDSKNDIAIIKLTDFTFSKIFNNPIPYPISSSNIVKQGNKVFTLGFPLGNLLGQTSKLSDGIINSLYGIQDDPRLMQISNPIQPGNSGGPLFNSSGEIIGIVVATLNAKYFYENADIIPQNVNFAVKCDYLLNLSSMLPEDKEITQRTNKLKGLSLDKQVEIISPFVVRIRAK
ncbi:MAG: serine protease [Bacteroidetes bacterium]|nr:MAG: serine protease [Bacteroidota bacterium]